MDITIQGEPAQQVGMNITTQAGALDFVDLDFFREKGNGCQFNYKTHV